MDEMDNFPELVEQLRRWHGRRQVRDGLIWLPRAVLTGLLLAVVLATVARLRPFLDNAQVGYVAVGAGVAGLLLGLLALLLRRVTLLQQARFADRQFRLQERVSTAVEIHHGVLTVPPDLAGQQLADTFIAVRRVEVQRDLPFRLERRDWLVLAVTVGLLVTAVLLPNPQADTLKKNRAVRESIAAQIKDLEALQAEIAQNEALTAEQQQQLSEPIQQALESLNAEELSQEQAVAALSEAEADLRALGAEFNPDDLQQHLETAGQSLSDTTAGQSLGEALQAGQLSPAGAAAAALAEALPSLPAEQQAELAQSLAETAVALQNVDPELAQQLAAAATALQNGETAVAQQALQEAAATLQQRAQEAAAAQQAQAAATQLQQDRQEVAQAGQSTTGQEQAQGQGDGQGQGQGDGQGQGEGQGQGQGESEGPGTGSGGTGPGGGHSETVFVPDLIDLSQEPGVDIELPAECIANPAQCGQLLSQTPTQFTTQGSTVPYSQVFGDYRDAAYEALSDDYIPLGLKSYIRDYFSSLEP